MRLAIAVLLSSAALAAQTADFEGIAINALTQKPLDRVHLRLISLKSMTQVSEVYGAVSGSDGLLSIQSVRAGSYFYAPERAGYVFVPPKPETPEPSSLVLKAGEKITGFRVEMAPVAIVSGRVLDEFGEPVPHVQIIAGSKTPMFPLLGFNGTTYGSTDDRGIFRLRLSPGKYWIEARPQSVSRGDGLELPTYGVTYHPGVPQKERAAILDAESGREIANLEFRLVRERKLTIAGTVTGLSKDLRFGSVRVESIKGSNRGSGFGSDGHFRFTALDPGDYRVYASASVADAHFRSAPVNLQLESDIDNLVLALEPVPEIEGALSIAGAPPGRPLPQRFQVRLDSNVSGVARGFSNSDESSMAGEDGVFRVRMPMPGKYRVRVFPLLENCYIDSVTVDGTPVPGGVVDLSSGARVRQIGVTLGMNGASISGKIARKDESAMPKAMAVLLVPEGESPSFDHASQTTFESRYEFRGLRPGKYKLFAVDLLALARSLGPEGDRAAALKELAKDALEIEIKPADRIVRDLTPAAKEAKRE